MYSCPRVGHLGRAFAEVTRLCTKGNEIGHEGGGTTTWVAHMLCEDVGLSRYC